MKERERDVIERDEGVGEWGGAGDGGEGGGETRKHPFKT